MSGAQDTRRAEVASLLEADELLTTQALEGCRAEDLLRIFACDVADLVMSQGGWTDGRSWASVWCARRYAEGRRDPGAMADARWKSYAACNVSGRALTRPEPYIAGTCAVLDIVTCILDTACFAVRAGLDELEEWLRCYAEQYVKEGAWW